MNRIKHLVIKDIKAEWRTGSNLGGLTIYSISTVFLCYRAFSAGISDRMWLVLLWLSLLFSSAFMAVDLFRHESGLGRLFYYSLVKPHEIYIGKWITAVLFQTFILTLTFSGFSLFFGIKSLNIWLFIAVLWLSGIAVTGIFTLSSAVASKSEKSGGLTAVLGLPLMVPVLMVSLQLAELVQQNLIQGSFFRLFLTLTGLSILPVFLGAGLFSYLWHD